jgi:hypothetical protein
MEILIGCLWAAFENDADCCSWLPLLQLAAAAELC